MKTKEKVGHVTLRFAGDSGDGYKICKVCGHAVKFYFPAVDSTSAAVKEYRQWKRYMVQ